MVDGSPSDGGGGSTSAGEGDGRQKTHKGKSCKGCLFHSSLRRSDGRNPLCVGITGNLPQVPSHIVGETEMEATKEGRSLSDFKYVCVGYSAFLDNQEKTTSGKGEENPAKLPLCVVGIEMMLFVLNHLLVHPDNTSHHNLQQKTFLTGSREMLDWWLLEWRGTCRKLATIAKIPLRTSCTLIAGDPNSNKLGDC